MPIALKMPLSSQWWRSKRACNVFVDRQLGPFDPSNAAAVQQVREDGGKRGGRILMDRQLGPFDASNAAAVQQGREDDGRNQPKAAKAKAGTKGGAAGNGVRKPRMAATEKAELPQGFCSGGCGAFGVVRGEG